MADLSTITVGSLAAALGIPNLQQLLDARDVKLKLGMNGFDLVTSAGASFSAPAKHSNIMSVLSGSGSSVLVMALKNTLMQAINSIPLAKEGETVTGKFSSQVASAAAELPLKSTWSAPPIPPGTTAAHIAPQPSSTSPVPLAQATEMYQLVKGSDTGSIYKVVAITSDLKMAARYKGKSLSFRVEGDIKTHFDKLKKAEINPNAAGTYASVHLSVDDEQLAARTLGALLCGLDMVYKTPAPQIGPLKVGVA